MINERDVVLGGGHYTCDKCGETVFGSSLHHCGETFEIEIKRIDINPKAMTEETIKADISHWYLTAPKGLNELAKSLSEQHDAEMVEFMNWRDKNYPRVLEVPENLLFLFKNRNK